MVVMVVVVAAVVEIRHHYAGAHLTACFDTWIKHKPPVGFFLSLVGPCLHHFLELIFMFGPKTCTHISMYSYRRIEWLARVCWRKVFKPWPSPGCFGPTWTKIKQKTVFWNFPGYKALPPRSRSVEHGTCSKFNSRLQIKIGLDKKVVA